MADFLDLLEGVLSSPFFWWSGILADAVAAVLVFEHVIRIRWFLLAIAVTMVLAFLHSWLKKRTKPPNGRDGDGSGSRRQSRRGNGPTIQVGGDVHGDVRFGEHHLKATLKIADVVKTRTPTVNPTGEAIYVQFPVHALNAAAEEAKAWLIGIRRFKAPDQWEQIYSESVRLYWSHTKADVMEAITISPGIPHNLNVLRVLSGPQFIELQVNAFAVPLALRPGVFGSDDVYVFDIAVSAKGVETANVSLTFKLGSHWDQPEMMITGVVFPSPALSNVGPDLVRLQTTWKEGERPVIEVHNVTDRKIEVRCRGEIAEAARGHKRRDSFPAAWREAVGQREWVRFDPNDKRHVLIASAEKNFNGQREFVSIHSRDGNGLAETWEISDFMYADVHFSFETKPPLERPHANDDWFRVTWNKRDEVFELGKPLASDDD